jgi:hypothetical protein
MIARAEKACEHYAKLAAEPGMTPPTIARRHRRWSNMQNVLQDLRRRRAALNASTPT